MNARERLVCAMAFGVQDARTADAAIDAYRAEVLREAADYLTKTYGATNRAASSLRRLAELEAQKGL